MDYEAAQAILKGLRKRNKLTGKVPVLIQTVGGSIEEGWLDPKCYPVNSSSPVLESSMMMRLACMQVRRSSMI